MSEVPEDEHPEGHEDSAPVPPHEETTAQMGPTSSQDVVDLHTGEDDTD